MGGISSKDQVPHKGPDQSKKRAVAPIEDDGVEDGDFATPKRDRNDEDDQPA